MMANQATIPDLVPRVQSLLPPAEQGSQIVGFSSGNSLKQLLVCHVRRMDWKFTPQNKAEEGGSIHTSAVKPYADINTHIHHEDKATSKKTDNTR